MLECLFVYLLAKHNSGIVEAKGQSGTSYKWLTAGLWLGGEIAGFMIGLSIAGRHATVLDAYPYGIAGAIAGAAIAWAIAKQVPVNPIRLWNPTHLTPPLGLHAWAQPNPALPPVVVVPGNVEVVVENRVGDWAMVRAANGWGGYVDARALVQRH